MPRFGLKAGGFVGAFLPYRVSGRSAISEANHDNNIHGQAFGYVKISKYDTNDSLWCRGETYFGYILLETSHEPANYTFREKRVLHVCWISEWGQVAGECGSRFCVYNKFPGDAYHCCWSPVAVRAQITCGHRAEIQSVGEMGRYSFPLPQRYADTPA